MATKGTVSGVIANMVTLVVDGPVAQNEICYISTGGDKLMAEVIKVVGTQVYVQVLCLWQRWATKWKPLPGWDKWTKTSNL